MKIKNLTVEYADKKIFDNLSIEFEREKITAILGNSGVGKTTLLNAIAKLLPCTGEISGVDGLSYVFQEPRLIEPLTVYDNLLYVLGGKNTEENKAKILQILQKVELEKDIGTLASSLSGGMKSRVALARAFLRQAHTLLMDEPMHSLDVGLKTRLREVLFNLLEGDRRTVLLVTHDVDEALSTADRIVVLGGSPAQIVWDKKNEGSEKEKLRTELYQILSKN